MTPGRDVGEPNRYRWSRKEVPRSLSQVVVVLCASRGTGDSGGSKAWWSRAVANTRGKKNDAAGKRVLLPAWCAWRLSYFSPLVLLPHAAEEPQAAELPHAAEEPHAAELPQAAELPHAAVVPQAPELVLERRKYPPDQYEIDCSAPDSGLSFHWLDAGSSRREPQTLVRLQVVLFHSVPPGWSKIPWLASGLYTTEGEAAEPLAVSLFVKATGTFR